MILNKAKEHYINLIKGNKIKIDIPEWDMTIYMRPMHHLSVSVTSKIKVFIDMANANGAAEVLVALATTTADYQGDKFTFTKADLHDLKHNVKADIVVRTYLKWVSKSNEIAEEESKTIKK